MDSLLSTLTMEEQVAQFDGADLCEKRHQRLGRSRRWTGFGPGRVICMQGVPSSSESDFNDFKPASIT